jgi:nitrite reductase/ring-hydroxylating ferredoxin subunit
LPLSPNGWFGVLRSGELRRGQVRPLRAFDRDLVAFRATDGRAAVLDAYCPHLGAHLGHGGRVVGGEVECPFHRWRFDGEGHCVHATGCDHPPRVALHAWPTVEVDGVVFIWYHAGGAAPSWQVPALPDEGVAMSSPLEIRWRVAAHIQEMRENIGDETHFQVIHRWPVRGAGRFEDHGHRATLRFSSFIDLLGRHLDFDAEVELIGPGISHLRVFGWARSRVTMLFLPVDSETSEVRILVCAADLFGLPMSRLLHAWIVRRITAPDVKLESLIWTNKLYLLRPVLLPHERSQRRIREWSRQFYETADRSPALGPPGCADS